MPARRRGQEGRRAERAASRSVVPATPDPIEAEWREHQAAEARRRSPLSPEEQADRAARIAAEAERREAGRARMRAEMLRARDTVLADFARWDAERSNT